MVSLIDIEANSTHKILVNKMHIFYIKLYCRGFCRHTKCFIQTISEDLALKVLYVAFNLILMNTV